MKGMPVDIMNGTVRGSVMAAGSNIETLGADPSFSLTLALRHVASRAGHEIDVDDLHAALGLSFMLCASLEEELAVWPTLARDAFLVEAGWLFGMGIRDMHPPEAARGLDRAEEFRQHFDASYRPLIQRALENGQPVLAWRGWTGTRTGLWGVITDSCADGIGFAGRVFGIGDESAINLSLPPVQLYVVETVSPEEASPTDLLASVIAHAATILRNDLSDPFAVTTGPAAYARWAVCLAAIKSGEPETMRRMADHFCLARSVTASHQSGLRFCGKWSDRYPADKRLMWQCLKAGCEGVVQRLTEFTLDDDAFAGRDGNESAACLAAAVVHAQGITEEMLAGLNVDEIA